jgi:hypothetical protein
MKYLFQNRRVLSCQSRVSIYSTIVLFILILATCLSALPAHADFRIAGEVNPETNSAVAYNSTANEFMVVYLQESMTQAGSYQLITRRFNATGTLLGITYPFGTANIFALGRPDIAYSPNSNQYYVAVAERNAGCCDRVLGRPLDTNGNALPGTAVLFNDTGYSLYDQENEQGRIGHSTVRVVHNSILDEFVVTMQRIRIEDQSPLPPLHLTSIAARRIKNGVPIGSNINIAGEGIGGFFTHSLAHAPIQTAPAGGRYLLAVEGGLQLFDSNLSIANGHWIPVH